MKLLFLLAICLVVNLGSKTWAANYCEYGTRTILILFDRTMLYDARDQELILESLDEFSGRLKAGDRVVVHTITSDYVYGKKAYDQCVPGCPGEGLFDKLTTGCSPASAKRDRRNFDGHLALVVAKFLKSSVEYTHSDIIRSIALVSESLSQDQRDDSRGNRKLSEVHLFSDLLENSVDLPWPTVVTKEPEALTPIIHE